MSHKLEITYEVKNLNSGEDFIEMEYYDFDIMNIDKMFDEYGNLYLSYINQYNKTKEINGILMKYTTIKGTLVKNHNVVNTRQADNLSCKEYIWSAYTNNTIRNKDIIKNKRIV